MSDHRDRDNELFSACEAGDVERVCWVITDGVDPKKATNQQYFNETPVHMYSLQVRLAMEDTRGGENCTIYVIRDWSGCGHR